MTDIIGTLLIAYFILAHILMNICGLNYIVKWYEK